jgi:hypothetical protein
MMVSTVALALTPPALAVDGGSEDESAPEDAAFPTEERIVGSPFRAEDGQVGIRSHANTVTNQRVTKVYPAAMTGCPVPAAAPSRNFDIRDGYVNSWITYHVASSSSLRFDWFYVFDGEQNQNHVMIWKSFVHASGPGTWCWESGQPVDGSVHQAKPGRWHLELFMGGNGQARTGTQVCIGMDTGCVWRYTVWPKIMSGGTTNSAGTAKTHFLDTDGSIRVVTTFDTTGAAIDHTLRYRWYRPDGSQHHEGPVLTLARGSSSRSVSDTLDIAATQAERFAGQWEVRPWVDGGTNYFHDALYFFTLAVDCTTDVDDDGLNQCQEARQGTDPTQRDTDGDGLTDLVESRWWGPRNATFCNGRLGAMANCGYPDPRRKDLYVEMDFMGPDHLPTNASLDALVTLYANVPTAANVDGS